MLNNPISLGIFCLIFLSIGLLLFLSFKHHKQQQHNQLLNQVVGAKQREQALKNNPNTPHLNNVAGKLKAGAPPAEKGQITLPMMLQQAGYPLIATKKFYLWSAVSGITVFLITQFFNYDVLPTILLTFVGFLGSPRWFLKRAARRRQKQFLADMPEALDAMVRLLKAGMPVIEAISMVGREFTGPIADEMLSIYEAQRVGISLPEATHRSAKRIPITEMQMLATAFAIQTETGSSLSEVLGNLSHVIRARFRLKRKIQALSAEAKASAMIIGSLPILVGLALNTINPTYMAPMFTEGRHMLYGSGLWMFCGIMVMRQMINFRI